MIELNKIIHADCLDIMKDIPDKYFELAIVDPPYGIDVNMNPGKRKNDIQKYENKKWDKSTPDEKYFIQLLRISKNQIVFGGNCFVLPVHYGWVVWDKMISGDVEFSECELIYTSFDSRVRKYSERVQNCNETRIHPTQKPISIYRWLVQNYAKQGDKIIDTHSGSGSCAIACHVEKFDFLAIEKDEDYYKASVNRLDDVRSQGVLF